MLTPEQVEKIEALYEDGHYMAKFCKNPKTWYYEACQIACDLGLRGGGVLRKKILDIGCGFGYFAKACQDLGHDVVGLDVPDKTIDTAMKVLGMPYFSHEIVAYNPLPESLVGFDLITTFGVNFRHSETDYWEAVDYQSLAFDIRSRLKYGGRWVLRPNQTSSKASPIAHLMDVNWWRNVVGPAPGIKTTEHEVQIRWQ